MSLTLKPTVAMVATTAIYANRHWNVRDVERYDGRTDDGEADDALRGLMESVKVNGVQVPLVVVPLDKVPNAWRKGAPKGASYFLVAGFRRYTAAQGAGLKEVPTFRPVQDDPSPDELLMFNAFENVARLNLTPFELALRFNGLLSGGKFTANTVAARLSAGGKVYSKSYVNNLARLARCLHPELLKGWRKGMPWATTGNLLMAAKHADATTGKRTPEQDAAQVALLKQWTGAESVSDDAGDDTGGGSDTPTVKANPTKQQVEKALQHATTLAERADKPTDRANLVGVVAALQWVMGRTAKGADLNPDTKPLKVGDLLVWKLGMEADKPKGKGKGKGKGDDADNVDVDDDTDDAAE